MSKTITIRCLVVDDEPLALRLVCDYVLGASALELIHATTNPVEALQVVYDGKIDLVFLDINMPELSGMNFLKIAGVKCKVVLVTAFHEYALEGYEHGVLDYLPKPLTAERFERALQRIEDHFKIHLTEQRIVSGNQIETPDFLFIRTEYKYQKLNLADINYLESCRDYVAVYTLTHKYLTLESMRSLEDRLPSHQFIRIHKSYLVALSKIDYVEKNKIFIGEKALPLSETYRNSFYKIIDNK